MAPSEKVHELCPNRNLLDANFNGYKLSLSPIPVYKQDINGIDVVEPSDEQYSFLHQKEFTLHNHLYGNLWDQGAVYYISNGRKVVRTSINKLWQLSSPEEVWEVPSKNPRVPGDFNSSMCFPTPDTVIISDGAGSVHILEISSPDQNWKHLHSHTVTDGVTQFKVVDCRSVGASPQRAFHCILSHIEPSKDKDPSKNNCTRFETVLRFLTLTEDSTGWTSSDIQTLRGPGSVEYCAIEPGGKALYVASDMKFESPLEEQAMETAESDTTPIYYWQQGFEDVKVWFELPPDIVKTDLKVAITETEITVVCKEVTLLSGKLFLPVDTDLSHWSFLDNKLEIVLQKVENKAMWQKFVDCSTPGKEIVDEDVVKEIHERLKSLCSEAKVEEGSTTMLNSSQLEDCDAFENESRTLVRLNSSDLKCTHKIMLGGQQWLLNFQLDSDKAPGFCVRNDVDGCVWQPEVVDEAAGDTWCCKHVGTFLAFGYIQASKEQKKFTSSPPDMSYIAITDITGHVMIYRRGIAVLGSLRNRKTGQKVDEIATQQLVNLQITGQVLGAVAANNYLFVLTSNRLYALHIVTE